MKILVTGDQSYIGRVFVPMLKGHDVLLYDQRSMQDICDERNIAEAINAVDAIVHLAAMSTPKACEEFPGRARQVNVEATKLINKLRKDKPIFFPNTNIGYGAKVKADIYDETSPMHPNSVYGKTKQEAECLIVEHGNYVVLRLASLFGVSPSMRWNLLLNFMVKEAFENGQLDIYEGHVRRNFLHVMDICRAFIHAINHYDAMKNNIYNAGLNHHPTKLEIADLLRERIPELKVDNIKGTDPDKRDYVVSNKKLIETGWRPHFSIEAGIKELVECLKS